jgi:hypothetical protein
MGLRGSVFGIFAEREVEDAETSLLTKQEK